MKLKEIREKYLSLQLPTNAARVALRHAGVTSTAADELMSLWVADEWERSVKYGPGTDRGNGGKG